MADIAYARLLLRYLKKKAVTKSATLISVLEDAAFSQVESINGGLVLVSASQNGHSVQNEQLPLSSGISAKDATDTLSGFLDNYETTKAALIAGGLTVPSDDVIFASMLEQLESVTSYKPNFGATAYA